jgi:tetratricopeptide (TPR) repeat protein
MALARLLLFWLLWGLAGTQTGCALWEPTTPGALNSGQLEMNDAYDRGVDYYRQGLYKSAMKELETVPPDHPRFNRAQDYLEKSNSRVRDATTHIDRALQYRKEGELFKARREFEEALEAYPRHRRVRMLLEALDMDIDATVNYYYEKGQDEFENRNYEEARVAYLEALKADPEEVRIITELSKTNDLLVKAYVREGTAFFEKGSFDEALMQLEKAYRTRSDDPSLVNQLSDLYNRRALKYYREDRLPQALADLKRSLEIKPDQAEVHNQLDQVQERLGQLEKIGH